MKRGMKIIAALALAVALGATAATMRQYPSGTPLREQLAGVVPDMFDDYREHYGKQATTAVVILLDGEEIGTYTLPLEALSRLEPILTSVLKTVRQQQPRK
jgi:hypothetical protein